jgi:hypothetical protein
LDACADLVSIVPNIITPANSSALYVRPIRGTTAGSTSHLFYDASSYEITYEKRDYVEFIAGVTSINLRGYGITNIGDIIPAADLTYSLGSTSSRWADAYIGAGSLHIGDSAVIGATASSGITSITANANIIPTTSLEYSLGSTAARWKEAFIGPGSLNIAGPSGSAAFGTIGTDLAGIVYTEQGFASPSIIVGPSPAASGAVGGWLMGVTGGPTSSDYDLVAQQNVNTAGGGVTGPQYSLIKGVVRSIHGGDGITVTAGTSGTTIALLTTGVTGGTYTSPASVAVNEYGQVTSITSGTTSTVPNYNLTKIVTGVTLGTTFKGITTNPTTITVAGGYLVISANTVVGNAANNAYFNAYVGITGPGTTAGTAGSTSDTSSFIAKTTNDWVQDIIYHDYQVPQAGTYYITLYAQASTGSGTIQNSHLLVQGNMTRSP